MVVKRNPVQDTPSPSKEQLAVNREAGMKDRIEERNDVMKQRGVQKESSSAFLVM